MDLSSLLLSPPPISTVISVCSQTLQRWQNWQHWPCHPQSSLLLQAQEHSLLRNSWICLWMVKGWSSASFPPRDEGWSCKTSCQAHWEVVSLQATHRKIHFSHGEGALRIKCGGILGEWQQQRCTGETTGRGRKEPHLNCWLLGLLSSSTEHVLSAVCPLFPPDNTQFKEKSLFPKQEIEKSWLISSPFCPVLMLILEVWGQHSTFGYW